MKSLMILLAVALLAVGVCYPVLPAEEDRLSDAKPVWIPVLEAQREQIAPGSQPGDYAWIDELTHRYQPTPGQ